MGKFLFPDAVRAGRNADEQDAPTDAELAKIVWPTLPWRCPGRCQRYYRSHIATIATLAPLADPSTATFLCIDCDLLEWARTKLRTPRDAFEPEAPRVMWRGGFGGGFVEGDRIARCACGHVALTEAEGVTKMKHCKTCRVLITLKCKGGRLTYGNRRT